jgi:hypothetical protein
MEMVCRLSMELYSLVFCDEMELRKLQHFMDEWGWCREKPSQRIIDILLERYKDGSDVTKFVEEIVGIDTLDKIGEWGACEERRVKMKTWEMECQHFFDLRSVTGDYNSEMPRLLPLLIGEAKAEETWRPRSPETSSGWWN